MFLSKVLLAIHSFVEGHLHIARYDCGGKTRSWTKIVFSISLSVSSMRVYDFKLSNHAGYSHLYI